MTGAEAIGGGRNSRVYRIATAGQQAYALKCYFPRADNRNCLAREFAALDFLRQNGIRNVPAAMAADEAAGCAAYEFIDGVKPFSDPAGAALSEADIDAAADFLCRLKELSQRPESAALPPAADACFSVAETLRYLRARLGRLQPEVRGQRPEVRCQRSDLGPLTSEFSAFMSGEFTPAMEAIVASATCRGMDGWRGGSGIASAGTRTEPLRFRLSQRLVARRARVGIPGFRVFRLG